MWPSWAAVKRVKIEASGPRLIFDRYNIVSENDLADAALKIERGAESVATKTATEAPKGQNASVARPN